jgi:hypothetical protein
VEFGLYDGLVALDDAIYKGYYEKGEHFATFMYLDNVKKDARRSLKVFAKCYADVTSATRVQDAKLKAIENGWGLIVAGTPAELEDIVVDATEPTAIVKALAVKAIAYTQGINGEAVWDGTLEFKDEFDLIDIPSRTFNLKPFEALVTTDRVITDRNVIPVQFGLIDRSYQVALLNLSDEVGNNQVVTNYTMNTDKKEMFDYDDEYVNSVQAFSLKTEYTYTSAEREIDNGVMCSVIIRTDDKLSVEGVIING